MAEDDLIAAVLVRGLIGMRHDQRRAVDILRLRQKHACIVLANTPMNLGLMQKAKDFITYGAISQEALAELKQKRPSLKDREGNELNLFRLHPPRGGWERGGIKKSHVQGGALGRRDDMHALLKRMV